MASHLQGATLPSANPTLYSQPSQTHHRQLHRPSSHPHYSGDDLRANTLANSYTSQSDASALNPYYNNHSLALPPQQQQYSNNGKFTEEWDASQRGSSIIDGQAPNMQRTNSYSSYGGEDHLSLPSRGNTLKKKNSLRRNGSLKRSSSRRSVKAGSVRSLALQSTSDPDEAHSAFHCPVPTEGNPTEVLANRFQSWRKILKDLIAYYREIQAHYEAKSKSLVKLANVANNISTPPGFLTSDGIDDAMDILRTYHKNSIMEANKAREIEEDVILALTGLRSDLHQKIKEIKGLSGDFKNSVQKEMDNTRKVVKILQDTIGQSDADPASATGKQDPYLLRLAVDRQVERQIDEENYLHQAYLNLESSGRELESIVVGEIQKAYNAYAGILKRESDAAYAAIDELRIKPISMPKDREWAHFVEKDDHFVDPDVPVRSAEQIHYPGQDHVSAQEIRAGLLERKSKYLKSYTAGWYVLSPTHLHEFKSADKAQAPVMSLYLPEQKLGSHSSEGGSSNKFILKGRQTGAMHRGHTWVFRAETHDTMMAWYEDIKALTEKTPLERSEFVRGHSRSLSQSSRRSVSSDGVVDEEDEEPFSADTVVDTGSKQDIRRPQPGGRFPSDIQVNAQRGLQAPLSPSSVSSGFDNQVRDAVIVGAIVSNNNRQGDGSGYFQSQGQDPHSSYGRNSLGNLENTPSHAAAIHHQAQQDGVNPYTNEPVQQEISSRSQARSPLDVYHQNESQNQDAVVRDLHRPPSRQSSQLPQPSDRVPRDAGPVVAGVESSRTDLTHDVIVEASDGNAQYGRWMNGGIEGTTTSPNISNGDYYSSGGRSTGDISHFPGLTSADQLHNGGTGVDPANEGPMQSREHYDRAMHSQQGNSPNIRPTLTTTRINSNPTISQLHIPGEYPKGTPTTEMFEGRVA